MFNVSPTLVVNQFWPTFWLLYQQVAVALSLKINL